MTSASQRLQLGLDAAIGAAGGSAALAGKLGLSPSAVSNWRGTGIPLARVPDVARVTGVPFHVLRPDVFPERSYAGFQDAQMPLDMTAGDAAAEARSLGLDPEAIAAAALRKAIGDEKARRWQEENREAIEAWNAWVDENELPLAKHRMF